MRIFEMYLEFYTHGKCHLFAIALNKVFGYQIQAIWDIDATDDDGESLPPALVHMYCVDSSGRTFDATGLCNKQDIYDGEYGDYNEPDQVNHSVEDVEKLIQNNVLQKPRKNEMERLINYINSNQEKYS